MFRNDCDNRQFNTIFNKFFRNTDGGSNSTRNLYVGSLIITNIQDCPKTVADRFYYFIMHKFDFNKKSIYLII